MVSQKIICLKLGKLIGSGAFSHVFSASEATTNEVYAVKKSRASLKLKRPLLAYEARVLKLLEGHPAIPKVIGYKRVEHFEYLALENLGLPLNDEQTQLSVKDTANIARQMLSALKYIHERKIVHRDIKPGNILAHRDRDLSRVCLIDFGLARPCITGTPKVIDLAKDQTNVVGTLAYASLNAYKGIDLNPRDDLQSLAYVLLSLLRGSLPWHSLCNAGTAIGRLLQIRRKMEAWTGTRLAEGYPPVFGELLDYARQLEFNGTIDYDRFIDSFQSLEDSAPSPDAARTKLLQASDRPVPVCPVEKGQLVLLQLDIPASVEGYTVRQDNTTYRSNPSFSGKEWTAPARPAIILSTDVDYLSRRVIKAIPLSIDIHSEQLEHTSLAKLGIDDPVLGNLDCYAFPRTMEFSCSLQQAPVISQWKISPEAADKLSSQYDRLPVTFNWNETKDPNPDTRYDVRMRYQSTRFYANIAPLNASILNESHLHGIPIEWGGKRGWFDECAKVARRRGWEEGEDWTGFPERTDMKEELETSYRELDVSFWTFHQQERDLEQSLPDEENIQVPEIDEIVE
ncbi:kinase-like domain-containing protein [Panaeolus papilionaceus]|nr:kinase-like domain-containing protein [Panaeolus papilionaceus]